MLEKKFKILCSYYSPNIQLIEKLWNQIQSAYTTPTRYYHNLNHLLHIYNELKPLKFSQKVWQELQFSLFYHDIIYNIKKEDNEKESAIFAKNQLSLLQINKKSIQRISKLINETKVHKPTSQINAYFLDADLAILGSSNFEYQKYIRNIRKEYSFYTDEPYKKGRKKVLESFLNKEKIFHTQYFYNKYEEQSQNNLLSEYHQL